MYVCSFLCFLVFCLLNYLCCPYLPCCGRFLTTICCHVCLAVSLSFICACVWVGGVGVCMIDPTRIGYGGGVWIRTADKFTLSGSTFEGNIASRSEFSLALPHVCVHMCT
jgi:hypothetical protein